LSLNAEHAGEAGFYEGCEGSSGRDDGDNGLSTMVNKRATANFEVWSAGGRSYMMSEPDWEAFGGWAVHWPRTVPEKPSESKRSVDGG